MRFQKRRHGLIPWDLRFTKIEYLAHASEAEPQPQRFKYTTRIGSGPQITGHGESTGNRQETTGLRTSALSAYSTSSCSGLCLVGLPRGVSIGYAFRLKKGSTQGLPSNCPLLCPARQVRSLNGAPEIVKKRVWKLVVYERG
jgi:hypothetical protein